MWSCLGLWRAESRVSCWGQWASTGIILVSYLLFLSPEKGADMCVGKPVSFKRNVYTQKITVCNRERENQLKQTKHLNKFGLLFYSVGRRGAMPGVKVGWMLRGGRVWEGLECCPFLWLPLLEILGMSGDQVLHGGASVGHYYFILKIYLLIWKNNCREKLKEIFHCWFTL